MKTPIPIFFIIVFMVFTVASCKKKDIEFVDKKITVNYDLEILKGNKGLLKINSSVYPEHKFQNYYFDLEYFYTKSPTSSSELWGLWMVASNTGGIEAYVNSPGEGIGKIEKGAVIDESTFADPASGGYFLSAGREFGQSDFTYHNNLQTEFYKTYYIPVKFPTINSNAMEGRPFYGYITVYLHPDKITIVNVVYNMGGKISAGE